MASPSSELRTVRGKINHLNSLITKGVGPFVGLGNIYEWQRQIRVLEASIPNLEMAVQRNQQAEVNRRAGSANKAREEAARQSRLRKEDEARARKEAAEKEAAATSRFEAEKLAKLEAETRAKASEREERLLAQEEKAFGLFEPEPTTAPVPIEAQPAEVDGQASQKDVALAAQQAVSDILQGQTSGLNDTEYNALVDQFRTRREAAQAAGEQQIDQVVNEAYNTYLEGEFAAGRSPRPLAETAAGQESVRQKGQLQASLLVQEINDLSKAVETARSQNKEFAANVYEGLLNDKRQTLEIVNQGLATNVSNLATEIGTGIATGQAQSQFAQIPFQNALSSIGELQNSINLIQSRIKDIESNAVAEGALQLGRDKLSFDQSKFSTIQARNPISTVTNFPQSTFINADPFKKEAPAAQTAFSIPVEELSRPVRFGGVTNDESNFASLRPLI